MRLRRLELLRYGHLADVALDFPAEAPLCVVHGANEAGKSTALGAISDALFGFGHRSRFDFLYPGPQLRVGFTLLDANGGHVSLVRRKGRGVTLRDAEGRDVPEEALRRFLGGATREVFEQSFGLDGEGLRRGGAALAEGHGAVGESLFAASTGLLHLRGVLESLDKEAKELVGDGKARRKLTVAVEAHKEATRAGDERAVAPKAWLDTSKRVDKADADLRDVQRTMRELNDERRVLDRVRRIAPVLHRLDAARDILAGLGAPTPLPDDAAETVASLREAGRQAARDREHAREGQTTLANERAKLARGPGLLAAGAAIDELAGLREHVLVAERELPDVVGKADVLRADLERALGDLNAAGVATPALEVAHAALPPDPALRAVRALVTRRAGLDATETAAATALAAGIEKRDRAAADLAAAPLPASPARLRATIGNVREEGRVEAELATAERRLRDASNKVEEALAALPLWDGDAAALAACPVPLPAAAATLGEKFEAARAAATQDAAVSRDLEDEASEIADQISTLARGEAVPTPDAVGAARVARDQAWQAIRDATAAPSDADAAGFEALRDRADRLADRRADEAQRVADYLSATARLDRLAQRRAALAEQATSHARALDEARAAWRALWAPAGVVPESPAAMEQWRTARDAVLTLIETEAERRRARDDLAARRDRARELLADVLPAVAGDATLAAALLRADEVCKAEEEAMATHARLAAARDEAVKALPALERATGEVAGQLATWREEWARATPALGLPDDCAVADAEAALDAWRRVVAAAPAWRKDAGRVGAMRRTVAEFGAKFTTVWGTVADTPLLEAPTVATVGLASRLSAAREAERKDEDFARRIAEHATAEAEARRQGREAEADLAALRQLAGVADDAGLDQAIRAAGARAKAIGEVEEETRALLTQGDGRDEAGLRAERGGVDLDAAAARIDAIDAETAELGERREALSGARAEALQTLAAMEGGRDAAAAAQEARDALADVQEAAERYARLHVAGVLLRSGIERFRRARQAPMLAAASACFALLTAGRYARLGVDDDEAGKPRLVAVRDDGTECAVEALSEGTRDQLYLALRVAAIEAFAQGGQALPFIADDLLVQFDDARAAAAIRVLARLGGTTQVVLFTHHEHVAALASAQAGVVVLRLPALVVAGSGTDGAPGAPMPLLTFPHGADAERAEVVRGHAASLR